MRLLIKLVISATLLFVSVFFISLFLPLKVEIEQGALLDAKPHQVFAVLNDPTLWEKWSPVNKTVDPSMIRLYSGPLSGVGARMKWSGDKVGSGQIILTESITPEMISYKEYETGSSVNLEGAFYVKSVEGGTFVTWKQFAEIEDSPLEKLKGIWVKYRRQKETERGLARLVAAFDKSALKKLSKTKVAYSEL
jgi:uncharacterized protein YndB with AHSA1/START domain